MHTDGEPSVVVSDSGYCMYSELIDGLANTAVDTLSIDDNEVITCVLLNCTVHTVCGCLS